MYHHIIKSNLKILKSGIYRESIQLSNDIFFIKKKRIKIDEDISLVKMAFKL